ncbi:hypothetical protein EII31_01030 [Leucobacter sp. OH2974_COT-288]|uniref:ATP-dependent Clp protease adapter protein ClpS n=1 Tax=Canibacter oris TaxID=1365628 RepID=A0A840DGJ5_9MICO|nr:ATP-dependent Clp protease adapter protein ClpS [Canibacter oris]RRD36202.1 hypothetical protein EII31_01030 [Leucobacter sp. OH2974_COT-288]
MTETHENGYWRVTIFDDDVNLASYVTMVLVHELHLAVPDAESTVEKISGLGDATVFAGFEDDCQRLVTTLHSYGLQAKMAPLEASGSTWN